MIISAPRFADGDTQIISETVELHCEGRRVGPRCQYQADYEIRQTTSETQASIITQDVDHLELTGEAGPADPEGPPEPLGPFFEDPVLADAPRPKNQVQIQRYRLRGEVGDRVVRVHAQLEPRPNEWWLSTPAAIGRHRGIAQTLGLKPCAYDKQGCTFWISHLPATPSDRAPGHRVTLKSSGPRSWSIDPQTLTVRTDQAMIAPGGPVIGIGARLDDAPVPAFRVGWELFAPVPSLAHAVAVEIDSPRRTTLVFSTELMSPMLLGILPSLGVGVGLPIRLTPEPVVGARGQVSVQLPYVGVLGMVDVYPSTTGSAVSPSVFLQLSL